MTLWSAKEAEEATGGRAIGDWHVTGVSIDTRTLQSGDLFIALKAARDGHDFVADALAAGAGAALVSRVPEGVDDTAPLLIVSDVQTALEDLGRAARHAQGQSDRGDGIGWKNIHERDVAPHAGRVRKNPCVSRQLQQSLGRSPHACADASGH